MSINVYHIGQFIPEPIYMVGIDVGINTGGITSLRTDTKQISMYPFQGNSNAMESVFPKLFGHVFSSNKHYIKILENSLQDIGIYVYKDVHLVIEYTGTWGQASIGIFTFLSGLLTQLLNLGFQNITLVPPIVGKHFLFCKYKEKLKSDTENLDIKKLINFNNINVSKTELKVLLESEVPDLLPTKTLKTKDKVTKQHKVVFNYTNHMGDSLLNLIFIYFDYFKKQYPNLSLTKPDLIYNSILI